MAVNKTIYQWCEHCKDEKLFDYNTVTCKSCGNKCKNYVEPKKK